MPDAVERLWSWLHTTRGRKLFRYTMVSVISTAVSATALGIVFGVFHVWSEVPSAIFANGVATFPSYWLNRSWAWGKRGRSHLIREVVPFWSLSALGIAFSIVGAAAARDIGLTFHLSHLVQTVVVEMANVLAFGIFWVAKLLVFNRIFRMDPLVEEIEEHLEAHGEPERATVR